MAAHPHPRNRPTATEHTPATEEPHTRSLPLPDLSFVGRECGLEQARRSDPREPSVPVVIGDESAAHSRDDRLAAIAHAELVHDAAHMSLDGLLGDVQLQRELLVRFP